MVLDSKIQKLRDHFGILDPEDWTEVSPDSVVAIPDIGPQTLDHLRLTLASRGITLKDDQTPAHWQSTLGTRHGATQVAKSDPAIVTPFTILVDTGEQQPFFFQGLTADANRQSRPLVVKTERKYLGKSHGDYSATGLEGWCHVERKSMGDAQSTVLGWGDRRDNFLETLDFLAEIPSSFVVIECTLATAIARMPSNGKKSIAENRKVFYRQVLAWMNDYRVPWLFCDDRRLAEVSTFRILERQWRKQRAAAKAATKPQPKPETMFPGL